MKEPMRTDPNNFKAWCVNRVFVWWDWLPGFVRRWAETNDHY